MFSNAQIAGWTAVVAGVHAQGAKIFIQLMHCGRIAHALNLPAGARILAPSAIAAAGQMYTDAKGMQPNAMPQAMSAEDIRASIGEYAQAASNAVQAGFDGVELHGANGYLLEQFIRPNSNQRADQYGGAIANRSRFVLEVAEAVSGAIGRDKVGIRLSPFGVFNDMPPYDAMESDYTYLAGRLDALGLLYIHLVDHSSMGAPPVPESIRVMLRALPHCALILSGGYDLQRAQSDLEAGRGDLIAVGRPILANPDLLRRWQNGAVLNAPDQATFYTAGAKGYTDYPALG
jgi:N-ethylmaleimide reductase